MRLMLDTNVLAYAEGVGDKKRCGSARKLVAELPIEKVVIPVQVLGELHRVLTGKAGRSAKRSQEDIIGWTDTFSIADTTAPALESALDLAAGHGLQIWDALIMAVAAENRCRLLISEDMQNGFTWRGVTVVNPFLDRKAKLLRMVMEE